MGYNVSTEEVNFTIPAHNVEAAYKAMCALNTTHDSHKSGGSYSGGQKTAKWFAWMDANYPETCKNAKEVLEQVGFGVHEHEDGSLSLEYYDSKTGQEELFIEAAGKYALPGWSIAWVGEDGHRWRQGSDGTESMASNVTVSEVNAMQSLLMKAVFDSHEDAVAARKMLTGHEVIFEMRHEGKVIGYTMDEAASLLTKSRYGRI